MFHFLISHWLKEYSTVYCGTMGGKALIKASHGRKLFNFLKTWIAVSHLYRPHTHIPRTVCITLCEHQKPNDKIFEMNSLMLFCDNATHPIYAFFSEATVKILEWMWNAAVQTKLEQPPQKQPEASLCVHILPVELNLETTVVSPAAVHHHVCKRENHNC